MCGITGIVSKHVNQDSDTLIVRKMMDSLVHRGPDGEGICVEKSFVFGHKRLAIIDLEHGKQPMVSNDGNLILIYNGEIYNYLELRQELTRQGVSFKTFSDTEVLLRLFEAEGKDCVKKLNGMFAFAIYNKKNNEFIAARDHFGIKPFYYFLLKNGTFVFASEIKALLNHPQIKGELDKNALDQYLTFQFCLKGKTLFKDVKKLEPASILTFDVCQKQTCINKYWEPSYTVDSYHTEDYFVDKIKHLLGDSIKGQLRSDVAIGGYLSGGLDSSTVVSIAAQAYGDNFQCFTGKFDEGSEYDESSYARAVCEKYSCIYHEAIPSAKDFVSFLPKLIYHMDEPAAGPGLFPQFIVSKLAKEHVTVVLGGQGGDEIFGGYARYMVAYLEQCLKGSIFETQEEGKHIVSLESIIPNLPILKQYVPMLKSFWSSKELFGPMDERYFKLIDRSNNLEKILHRDIWEAYDSGRVFDEFQNIFNHADSKSYLNKMLHFDQSTLLPALLQVEDRVSMAVSLESRVPILDYRLADLLASMPPGWKFKGGKTKHSLQQAVKSVLPPQVLSRKDKMGFPVPLSRWWAGDLKDFVSDVLLSKASRERGLFNVDELLKLISSENQFGRQLWGALCLELWHQEFIDG